MAKGINGLFIKKSEKRDITHFYTYFCTMRNLLVILLIGSVLLIHAGPTISTLLDDVVTYGLMNTAEEEEETHHSSKAQKAVTPHTCYHSLLAEAFTHRMGFYLASHYSYYEDSGIDMPPEV